MNVVKIPILSRTNLVLKLQRRRNVIRLNVYKYTGDEYKKSIIKIRITRGLLDRKIVIFQTK